MQFLGLVAVSSELDDHFLYVLRLVEVGYKQGLIHVDGHQILDPNCGD